MNKCFQSVYSRNRTTKWNFMIRLYLFQELCQDFSFIVMPLSSLCMGWKKVPPRPWFWSSLGARTGRTPVFCRSSPPWAQWPFAPVSASIRTALEFPPSSLIPSSHILMSSSSVRAWSRGSLCSWLCWSMVFMVFTIKPSATTAPGTQSAFLGARMVDVGHSLLMAWWSPGAVAWTVLIVLDQTVFSLSGRSRTPLGAHLRRMSHSQGASQSSTFGIEYWTAAKSTPWKRSVHPFLLGWCSSGV